MPTLHYELVPVRTFEKSEKRSAGQMTTKVVIHIRRYIMAEGLKRRRETEGSAGGKRVKTTAVQSRLPFSAVRLTPPPDGQFPGTEVHIACWNVNGLRACIEKDPFLKFIEREDLDILTLNEHKLQDTHIEELKAKLKRTFKFQYFNCSIRKKGYSGVAILSKTEAIRVEMGIGVPEHDTEGRVLLAEFAQFCLIVVYTPNSGTGLCRLDYRTSNWDPAFLTYLQRVSAGPKPLICMGDFNVVHQPIDINETDRDIDNVPGTTQLEKDCFTTLLNSNVAVDSFRHLHPAIRQFSWFATDAEWKKEQGWRLDYALVSPALLPRVKESLIHDKIRASDHHPIEIILDNHW